jgi:hypothetical protein
MTGSQPPAATALRPGTRRGLRPRRLTSTARKGTLIVHLISSVGWLALGMCLLTLGVTALTTSSADAVRASYRAMQILGDALILPLSLLSLASGLVLALGTPWGLFRYHWVSVKFWLTLAATAASNLALRARLDEVGRVAAQHPTGSVSAMHLGFIRYNLVIIPSVVLVFYSAIVVLSVVKPWGRRTRRP